MRIGGLLLVGTIAFVVISYLEQVPVLGWLGAIVSVAAWVTLARAAVREGGSAPVAALLGGWTGFVGAATAWALQTGNLVAFNSGGLERVGAGFGFVGASLGLFYWPLIGAAVCFGVAFLPVRRRFA
ncbi:MAG TPA: hypothetical protein VGR87_15480 [Candidatus Limnocylindria bacterium]|jgi:hypothetical protein|nr:hypothetical protein [Candidatus Limnocylindria bacterium]